VVFGSVPALRFGTASRGPAGNQLSSKRRHSCAEAEVLARIVSTRMHSPWRKLFYEPHARLMLALPDRMQHCF
jgi:hypothetical protein